MLLIIERDQQQASSSLLFLLKKSPSPLRFLMEAKKSPKLSSHNSDKVLRIPYFTPRTILGSYRQLKS